MAFLRSEIEAEFAALQADVIEDGQLSLELWCERQVLAKAEWNHDNSWRPSVKASKQAYEKSDRRKLLRKVKRYEGRKPCKDCRGKSLAVKGKSLCARHLRLDRERARKRRAKGGSAGIRTINTPSAV